MEDSRIGTGRQCERLLACAVLLGSDGRGFAESLRLQSMLMTMTRRTQSLGMSLVELMIVVVIIGILAAISMVGYRKYVARARLSEATAMLAEFAAKEQLFFLENGQYLEAHNTGSTTPVYLSTNENAAEFWPQDPSGALFDSARTPQLVAPLPTSWLALGVRPRWQQLYCTYMVNAGPANVGGVGNAPPPTVGPTLWPTPPNVPWFYAMAVCNLGGAAGWPVTPPFATQAIPVTVMMLTHDSPAIRTIDETF
jgi:prepilin-type N-terminal cleavage/methylation domain-containing protein